ncbi:MAG TPA: hypothetical protein VGM50_20540 [Gemmatimonadaceae bacterium]
MLTTGGVTVRRIARGLTLVELTVALSLAGLVLAIITGIAVRQQRIFGDLAQVTSLEAQLREAVTVLPIDMRAIAPSLGDLRDARDTAIEFRATIGTAIVCDTSADRLILYPAPSGGVGATGATRYSSFPTPIAAGDTAWLLSVSDTSERWVPYAIRAVGSVAAGECADVAPALDSAARGKSRLTITLAAAESVAVGMPVRFTRPVRYSLYHASDGEWYLGERDWNAATARFNTIQPVAGPFLSAPLNGMRISYFDTSGAVLPLPIVDLSAVGGASITVHGQTRGPVRAIGAGPVSGRRVDSASVVIAFRGAR